MLVTNQKARKPRFRAFLACYKASRQTGETSPRKIMSADDKKTKTAPPKKVPANESKTAEAAPKSEGAKSEGVKSEGVTAEAAKPDAAQSRKGMGGGQKPVTRAYKDNWNAIFGKKMKTR